MFAGVGRYNRIFNMLVGRFAHAASIDDWRLCRQSVLAVLG